MSECTSATLEARRIGLREHEAVDLLQRLAEHAAAATHDLVDDARSGTRHAEFLQSLLDRAPKAGFAELAAALARRFDLHAAIDDVGVLREPLVAAGRARRG